MIRLDGRRPDEMRPVRFKKNFLKFAEGSCLVEVGNTRVICSASVEENVPPFLRGQGKGWVTAEYGMLPRSCRERIPREGFRGRPGGRTQEISRIIGRCLRAVIDLEKLGERSIWLDCDVLQGDGGTRTASVTGSFIALSLAVQHLQKQGIISSSPIKEYLAAVSVGIREGAPLVDLDYDEDSKAQVDMNVVMTESGRFVEVQGTAESKPFSKKELNALLELAQKSIQKLITLQKEILKSS